MSSVRNLIDKSRLRRNRKKDRRCQKVMYVSINVQNSEVVEDKSGELDEALTELDIRMAELDEAKNEAARLKIMYDQEKAASGTRFH